MWQFFAFFFHGFSIYRVSSNANYWTTWKPTNLNWQRMKWKRFLDWTKIWEKLFQSTNWRMDQLFCGMEKVVIIHFIMKRKCWNKLKFRNDFFFSVALQKKNAWNIHKFMGHKRVAKKLKKKWIKSFCKKKAQANFWKIQCPTFISRLVEKSFPICINYHYITMTSYNNTYKIHHFTIPLKIKLLFRRSNFSEI